VRVFAAFFGGAVVCLGISAGYHLLANHSLWVAGWGNRADYLGWVFVAVVAGCLLCGL
jgi:adiponectin receptor